MLILIKLSSVLKIRIKYWNLCWNTGCDTPLLKWLRGIPQESGMLVGNRSPPDRGRWDSWRNPPPERVLWSGTFFRSLWSPAGSAFPVGTRVGLVSRPQKYGFLEWCWWFLPVDCRVGQVHLRQCHGCVWWYSGKCEWHYHYGGAERILIKHVMRLNKHSSLQSFCDLKVIALKRNLKSWNVNSDKAEFRFKDKNKILKLMLKYWLWHSPP